MKRPVDLSSISSFEDTTLLKKGDCKNYPNTY